MAPVDSCQRYATQPGARQAGCPPYERFTLRGSSSARGQVAASFSRSRACRSETRGVPLTVMRWQPASHVRRPQWPPLFSDHSPLDMMAASASRTTFSLWSRGCSSSPTQGPPGAHNNCGHDVPVCQPFTSYGLGLIHPNPPKSCWEQCCWRNTCKMNNSQSRALMSQPDTR